MQPKRDFEVFWLADWQDLANFKKLNRFSFAAMSSRHRDQLFSDYRLIPKHFRRNVTAIQHFVILIFRRSSIYPNAKLMVEALFRHFSPRQPMPS
jgi:SPX domain protein involved in polyphosphate accumulation